MVNRLGSAAEYWFAKESILAFLPLIIAYMHVLLKFN